jgi:hypothetical protein
MAGAIKEEAAAGVAAIPAARSAIAATEDKTGFICDLTRQVGIAMLANISEWNEFLFAVKALI